MMKASAVTVLCGVFAVLPASLALGQPPDQAPPLPAEAPLPAQAQPPPAAEPAPALPVPDSVNRGPRDDESTAVPAALGPSIELPPETTRPANQDEPSVQLGVAPEDSTLSRGLGPARMAQRHTVVGGYGQFGLNAWRRGTRGEFDARASVRRLVLFVAHPITDDIRIYSEFEWENALACQSCVGSAEVEQAFVQWRLLGDALALRAGLVLVPMGIVNQWHEPPVFHGVERPAVDTFIIPTTWRELGVGITGSYAELARYELYVTTTLDPLLLGENGIAGARTLGAVAPAKAFAVTGRAEVEPILGLIAGASFFLSNLGPNGDYYDADGRARDLTLPLLGYALDARIRRAGFEARVVWSQFFMPNSDALVNAYDENGRTLFPDITKGTVPERIQGGYIELAYNLFALAGLSHELLAFARLESYDTQAAVPTGHAQNPELDIRELTTGLTYRPIPQLVFKTDLQLRDRRLGLDDVQWNLGFGYMF
jgi:hypothetical protein